jgi:hypothetical protein
MSTDYLTASFMNVDSETAKALRGKTISEDTLPSLESNINQAQNNELNQIFNTSEQSATTALNYGSLFTKNQSISLMVNDLKEQNKKVNNGARDTYARQAEINEWQAQNKLDTLFFLQILFLYFAVLVILIFLRQSSLIPSSMLYIIGGIGLLIVIGVLWNRAGYTSRSRDKRYWNRRYIGLSDSGDLQAKLQCSLS